MSLAIQALFACYLSRWVILNYHPICPPALPSKTARETCHQPGAVVIMLSAAYQA